MKTKNEVKNVENNEIIENNVENVENVEMVENVETVENEPETNENEPETNENEPNELETLKNELARLRELEAQARAKVKEAEEAQKRKNAKPTRKFYFFASLDSTCVLPLNERKSETFYYIEKDIVDYLKASENEEPTFAYLWKVDYETNEKLLIETFKKEDGQITIE